MDNNSNNGILSNQMKFCWEIFYLSKGLFAPESVRLQILKAAFRIHSCYFWQQRSRPTSTYQHFIANNTASYTPASTLHI